MPIELLKVSPEPAGLSLYFSGHPAPRFLSWRWLRDHGTDPDSLDVETQQRKVDTFSLPENLTAQSVDIDNRHQELALRWTDDVTTRISLNRLTSVLGLTPGSKALSEHAERRLWDADNPLTEHPCVDYEEVMSSDPALLVWLDHLFQFGFTLITQVPTSDAATEALAERLGPVQETLFGRYWPLSAELTDHGDSAYSNDYLDPHTDGTYYHDAPGLQLFNCQQFDGKGGESVQVDGYAAAGRLRVRDPEAYRTLTRILVPGHYLESGHHVRAARPVLRLDLQGELEQVTFNNYDRAPFVLSPEDEVAFYHAYGEFYREVSDQRHWIKLPLRPGTALVFDNWRNLHGRMGYVGKRVLYGCYHSRATYESRARTLRKDLAV